MSDLDPQSRNMAANLQKLAEQAAPNRPLADVRAEYQRIFSDHAGDIVTVGRISESPVPCGPPGEMRQITIRLYEPGDPDITVPLTLPSPRILVLFFHGGGWSLGDSESYDSTLRQLCAASGTSIASIDYRLAPEHPYPAALDDALAVYRLALDLVPGRYAGIVVMGDSAGGTLAAALCLRARDAGLPQPMAQILLYAVLDLRSDANYPSRKRFGEDGYFLTNQGIRWAIDNYLPDPDLAAADTRGYISPLAASDLEGLAPAVIVTSACDPLRDENESYGERLKEAGALVRYSCFPATIHGFLSFAGSLDVGRAGLRYVAGELAAISSNATRS